MTFSCIAGKTMRSGETSDNLEYLSLQFSDWPLMGLYREDLIVLGVASKLGTIVSEWPKTIKSCAAFLGILAPLGTCQVCGYDFGKVKNPCDVTTRPRQSYFAGQLVTMGLISLVVKVTCKIGE